MTEKKPLAKRAIDVMNGKATSTELQAMYSEIAVRLTEVDSELPQARAQVDNILGEGDIDALRAVRQQVQDLTDEDKILRCQSTEIYRAMKIAKGEEAVATKPQLDKILEKTLAQAQEAQAVLEKCRLTVGKVIEARRAAAEIGEALNFAPDTVRPLAVAIHSDSNAGKQAMIDLGGARLVGRRCM